METESQCSGKHGFLLLRDEPTAHPNPVAVALELT